MKDKTEVGTQSVDVHHLHLQLSIRLDKYLYALQFVPWLTLTAMACHCVFWVASLLRFLVGVGGLPLISVVGYMAVETARLSNVFSVWIAPMDIADAS